MKKKIDAESVCVCAGCVERRDSVNEFHLIGDVETWLTVDFFVNQRGCHLGGFDTNSLSFCRVRLDVSATKMERACDTEFARELIA